MSFANPAALAFSVFVAGLIILYLWQRNRQRIAVPSLMFWDVVPEAVVRRTRFQPDLLFWLQLAGLAALILGLADPRLHGSLQDSSARNAILVLDASASMQALEPAGRRFELAQAEAVRIIESSSGDTRFMVIAAAREPVVVAPYSEDRESLITVVRDLETRDVASNLEPALATARRLAMQADEPVEIHVLTDVPRNSVEERWRKDMHWWPFGATGDNLAIVGVETSSAILGSDRNPVVHVIVRNFGRDDKHASLSVSVDGQVAATELFTAKPRSEQRFQFSGLTGPGLFEASLQDGGALAVDDRWRSFIPPTRQLRIALASSHPELRGALERIADASGTMSVEQWEDGGGGKDVDLVILHRTAVADLPDRPTLLIAPKDGADVPGEGDVYNRVEVVDWRDDHAALRGIDPQLFHTFRGVRPVTVPSWGETVLTGLVGGREVPLLVAGRAGSHRAAIVAPDLAEEGLLPTNSETNLLLFLNLLDWLTAEADWLRVVRTGESLNLDDIPATVSRVIDPRGRDVDLSGESRRSLPFDHAGTYELHSPGQAPVLLFANFQDANESDIGRPPSVAHRAELEPGATTSAAVTGKLPPFLYLSAVLLLIAEWLAASRVPADG